MISLIGTKALVIHSQACGFSSCYILVLGGAAGRRTNRPSVSSAYHIQVTWEKHWKALS